MTNIKLEDLIKKGSELIFNHDYDNAESIFTEVLNIDSNLVSPFVNLGMINLLKGEIDKSIEFLKKAIEIDHRSLEAHQNLGSCYLKKEDYDNAEKMYLKALQIDPNNFNTYHNLSSMYVTSQQWNKAKKPLEKILQIDESNYQSSFYLGLIYLTSKEYYPSVANFLYTLSIKPDYHTARLGLADALYKIGRYKASLLELKTVIDALPDFVTPYVKSSLIHIETGENEKAIPLLEKSISLNDSNVEVIEILSIIYEEKGEFLKAEELYQQILIKDPENRSAVESLERLKVLTEKLNLSVS